MNNFGGMNPHQPPPMYGGPSGMNGIGAPNPYLQQSQQYNPHHMPPYGPPGSIPPSQNHMGSMGQP